jgi:lauroyl/myristoyl acyltransferase
MADKYLWGQLMEGNGNLQAKLAAIAEKSLQASKDDLKKVGYDLCYLNLLAAFGASRTPEEVEELAIACMRNYYRSSAQFATLTSAETDAPGVEETMKSVVFSVDFKPGVLDAIRKLQQTSGVFISTYHWGGFRLLSLALANQGLDVTLLMDRITHNPGSKQGEVPIQAGNMTNHLSPVLQTHFDQRVKFVVAEDKTALVRIYRAIAVRNLVMIYPDGNSGWDGPKGHDARIAVSFLGQTINVKTGIGRLAVLMQAPIVTLTAENQRNGRVLVDLVDVLHPPPSQSDAAQAFIDSAMQRIYSGLERCVVTRPEQWESSRHLHRWREPATGPRPEAPAELRLKILDGIESGLHYSLDRRRVARVVVSGREVLVDAHTMCAYEADGATVRLVSEIADRDSFARAWEDIKLDPARRATLLRLLALLSARGLLMLVNDLVPSAPGDSIS